MLRVAGRAWRPTARACDHHRGSHFITWPPSIPARPFPPSKPPAVKLDANETNAEMEARLAATPESPVRAYGWGDCE